MLQKTMCPDHLKPETQHNADQSAEEIRADADIIRAETERLKEVLRRLERENEVYSSNKWRLEPEKKAQEAAKGSQEKK